MRKQTAKMLNALAKRYNQPPRLVKKIWNSIPRNERHSARREGFRRLEKMLNR